MTREERQNQTAIVTGGSQGIGLATVAMLAEQGFNVVAVARHQERLEQAVSSLPASGGGTVIGIAADVSDAGDVERVMAETDRRFGGLSVLVNSAGVSMSARHRFVDSPVDEWHRNINTNLTGTFLMCRAALPLLAAAPSGYILNVLSTAAHKSSTGFATYAASKFGARALTEALIDEYRNSSIRVTSVSPGPVNTTIWGHKLEEPSEEYRASMLLPSDIAEIFGWLLSRPARLHIPDIAVTPWVPVS